MSDDAPDLTLWPHAVFDLLALTSAFFASVSIAPLLAFGASDYADADARALRRDPTLSATSISSGMALWAPLSLILSGLSLIASGLARMLAEVERRVEKRDAHRRGWLHCLIWPFAILAAVPLAVAIVIYPNSLYYAGFVCFPDSVAATPRWIVLGATLEGIAGALILGALGVFLFDRCVLVKHSKQLSAASPAESYAGK